MATIKSYTSVEQSRKLAEILPLESADMKYKEYTSGLDYSSKLCGIPSVGRPFNKDTPCWSLSALLGVLPRIDIEKEVCFKTSTYDYRVKAYIGDGYVGEWHDNPVDACVEMIIKLHELNLL